LALLGCSAFNYPFNKNASAMNKHGQTVCLNMIVKNEAHVIQRCLDSVRPIIDTWVIVDTGSTDATQAVIREHLKDLPGELFERSWINFAHNRSEALLLTQGRASHILVMDADDTLEIANDFIWPHLNNDVYTLEIYYGSNAYRRRQLIRNGLPWYYEGVLHEYLTCSESVTEAFLQGLRIIPYHDGARSRDPETYKKDAKLLEQALIDEPDNSRYVFYLAQSYRDADEYELAIKYYQRRIEMGDWEEEIWCSMYEIPKLQQQFGIEWEAVLQNYLVAYEYKPGRAEPLYHIAMYYQQLGNYHTAYIFFRRAIDIPIPSSEHLFVEMNIYQYLLPLEYAVCCYYVGNHTEAIATNKKLLAENVLPENLRELVTQNLQFSLKIIRGQKALYNDIDNIQHLSKKRLNLGCGRNILSGWINIDSIALPGVDVIADLELCEMQPLPFKDNSVDEFLLVHVIEHIRNILPLMQELWRIAKPSAHMVIHVPHGASDDAWEDPTHIRAFFYNSFGYFSQPYYWRADYGYRGDWRLDKLTYVVSRHENTQLSTTEILDKVRCQRNIVQEMIAELTPVKPMREPKRELQHEVKIHIQFSI
jgi:glycosyltransferase involved in cell wall biosynthesis